MKILLICDQICHKVYVAIKPFIFVATFNICIAIKTFQIYNFKYATTIEWP